MHCIASTFDIKTSGVAERAPMWIIVACVTWVRPTLDSRRAHLHVDFALRTAYVSLVEISSSTDDPPQACVSKVCILHLYRPSRYECLPTIGGPAGAVCT